MLQGSSQPAAGGPPAPPSVSLPKGGGAIRDIGEKFTVNAATGTASLAIPVATSPGRAGFGPSLSLTYDSGAGNGPFGLGWKISLPAITRKTDKGLPRYHDDPDQDTFILSGAEDLVPVREERDGALGAGARAADRRRQALRHPALPAADRGAVRADRALAGPWLRRNALADDHLGQRHHDLRRHRRQPHRGPGRPGARIQLADLRELRRHRQRRRLRLPGRGQLRASTPPWPASATAPSGPGRRAATRSGSGTATGCPGRLTNTMTAPDRTSRRRLDVRGRLRLRRP